MKLENTYARSLDSIFYQKNVPASFPRPELLLLNEKLVRELSFNLDGLTKEDLGYYLSGQRLFEGSEPLSQAYAGHQYAYFTNLGDGRAHLLGEWVTPHGERFDLQLKGSGQSQYSRRGDGRSSLGPMLREYLISEAMACLGVPSTRSLAVTLTGEMIRRESFSRGAVLARIAASHIRVGTFQFAAVQNNVDLLRQLTDYCVTRHFSELLNSKSKYIEFFRSVCQRQARLLASWMSIGFVHGVMNTDNMSIAGETIDYGPCAFLDHYEPNKSFSSIDRDGRYAFSKQPEIARWNLARLGECLLPLLHDDQVLAIDLANEVLVEFKSFYEAQYYKLMSEKLGFTNTVEREVVDKLLVILADNGADYTFSFLKIARLESLESSIENAPEFKNWKFQWQDALQKEGMSLTEASFSMMKKNPVMIPRNYWVEAALTEAVDNKDLSLFLELFEALQKPFDQALCDSKFSNLAPPMPKSYATFCGT